LHVFLNKFNNHFLKLRRKYEKLGSKSDGMNKIGMSVQSLV